MSWQDAIKALIRSIPRGRVATYGQVAAAAGLPNGARRVARVLRTTHDLPWQRVVGAGGQIKIPGEGGLEQRLRLEMEGVHLRSGRVPLAEYQHEFRPWEA